jgi:hypothetical protein
MLDKNKFRLKCKLLASQIAKSRLPANKIPEYIAKHKWFMDLCGVNKQQQSIQFASGGAIKMFGKQWCDEAMNRALIETGAYHEASTDNPDACSGIALV